MKKILLTKLLALGVFANAQIITQNSTPNIVNATGSVSCASPAAGPNYYTADNSYLRLFKLSDYGITYDYKITNIAFGVQLASRTVAGSSTDVGGTFPVEVWLYSTTGTTPDFATMVSYSGPTNPITTVNVSSANNTLMVNTGTSVNQVIPAGSNFVLEIFHDGSNTVHAGTAADPFQRFYMGTNPNAQSGPSYLASTTCGITTPLATGTGALASFGSARWVMTITGINNLGVTEVINSKDLQIYPNPVKDILKFRFNNNLKSESIEIFDLNGRVITSLSNVKNLNEINVSHYSKGNYILKVKADDGKVYIQKLIKE